MDNHTNIVSSDVMPTFHQVSAWGSYIYIREIASNLDLVITLTCNRRTAFLYYDQRARTAKILLFDILVLSVWSRMYYEILQ